MIKVKKITKLKRVKKNAVEINIVFFFGGRLPQFSIGDTIRCHGFKSGETRTQVPRTPDFLYYSCRKRKFDENK